MVDHAVTNYGFRQRSGLSLVELLVVVAIIGLLVGLLLPAVQAARESARRTECTNHLRQIGIGFNTYISKQGRFPPGKKWSGPRNAETAFSIAWSAFMLHEIDESTIYDQLDFRVPFTDPVNLPAAGQVVSVYLCPSTSRLESHRGPDHRLLPLGDVPGGGMGCIDYLGISGPDKDAEHPVSGEEYGRQRGVLLGTKGLPDDAIEPPPIKPRHITDGLSHTACVTECTGRGVEVEDGVIKALSGAWASGSNVSHINKSVNETEPPDAWYKERIFSDHPGGANMLMCDASVHFLTEDVEEQIIMSLCSRDGGETMEPSPF